MSFVTYTPRPSFDSVSALDFRGLDKLKRGVQDGAQSSPDALRQVASQFEALFIQQMLKQARQVSAMTPGMLDSHQTQLAQSMRDEQLATQLAEPGFGLAQALLHQIRQSQGLSALPLDRTNTPPELAASRLPGMRSSIGEERRPVAESISDLLGLLQRSASQAGEKLVSAIRGAPGHIQNFVDKMSAAATVAAAQSGVPEKLILSQAALESGWGKREILREDGTTTYNLFGIKAGKGWKGEVAHIMTTEYENGVPKKVMQPFRAYQSYEESFADYARLISQNDRYSDVLHARDAEDAARRIQEAGYATDPAYAEKLISIMSYFDTGPVTGRHRS